LQLQEQDDFLPGSRTRLHPGPPMVPALRCRSHGMLLPQQARSA